MEKNGKFILLSLDEFAPWLNNLHVARKISILQVHHTYLPDYKTWAHRPDHFKVLHGMEDFQVHDRGFAEIAQNITTFPDGKIAICRDFNTIPAGIKGCNSNGLCIENLGNFDEGGDTMTPEHRAAILGLYSHLCTKFNLVPSTDTIVYHHWYDLSTGKRTNGTGVTKTCPGTAWFGGNSVEAAAAFIAAIKEIV